MSPEREPWIVATVAGSAYFGAFPDDLPAVVAPVREVLALTDAVSPWLYGVLAAAVIAWAIVRCLGRNSGASEK
jgi:hypothetical protein